MDARRSGGGQAESAGHTLASGHVADVAAVEETAYLFGGRVTVNCGAGEREEARGGDRGRSWGAALAFRPTHTAGSPAGPPPQVTPGGGQPGSAPAVRGANDWTRRATRGRGHLWDLTAIPLRGWATTRRRSCFSRKLRAGPVVRLVEAAARPAGCDQGRTGRRRSTRYHRARGPVWAVGRVRLPRPQQPTAESRGHGGRLRRSRRWRCRASSRVCRK